MLYAIKAKLLLSGNCPVVDNCFNRALYSIFGRCIVQNILGRVLSLIRRVINSVVNLLTVC